MIERDPEFRAKFHKGLAFLLAIFVVTLLLGMLTGCALFKAKPRAEPVNESCDASCRLPCDTAVPRWAPVDADDPAAWDAYVPQVTIPLAAKLQTCEVARQACVQCLDRLKAAGVTK
jgi:hypothetical protein